MKEILDQLLKTSDRAQALGLAALICVAQREETSVAHQFDEFNFSDISSDLIVAVDSLSEDSQLHLVSWIAHYFQHESYPPAGAIA